MKIIKSNILIIIALVIIVVLAQVLRMEILVDSASTENIVENEYSYNKSLKLTETEKKSFTEKLFLILYDEYNDYALNNIKIICDYLKIDYYTANTSENIDLSIYKTIILLEQNINENIINLDLFNYVKNGGKLLYLSNGNLGETDLLYINAKEFGIEKIYEIQETNYVYFNTEVLLGLTGLLNLVDNEFEDFNNFEYLQVDTSEGTLIHIEEVSGSPLLWEKSLEKGKIAVLNTGLYESKENRALLVGAISLIEDLFIYPIINSEVVFIDDFPADYKSDHLVIRKNYGRDFERFIKEIWWPDMVNLIKKYNLKLTSAYIQSYNDIVNGPFDYNKSTDSTTKELVHELIKYDGEVSYHGYNHQSLLYKQTNSDKLGYNAWPSEEKIVEAVSKSISDFNKIYPNYIFYTYVPPSNLLEDDAIPALIKAIPTLRTISGLYFGELDDDGQVNEATMEQEIGINDYNLVDLPRITSGSFLNDTVKYRISSLVTMHGIINHFIHPDDILDPERSLNMLWNELYNETDNFFAFLDTVYPWMNKDTASITSEKVKQMHYSKIYYDLIENNIQIAVDNFHKEISIILVTEKDILSSLNCKYEKIGFNRYLVTMQESKASLGVR